MEQRIRTLRTELDGKGWERIVTVKDQDQEVGVFIKTKGQETVEGLVVTLVRRRFGSKLTRRPGAGEGLSG